MAQRQDIVHGQVPAAAAAQQEFPRCIQLHRRDRLSQHCRQEPVHAHCICVVALPCRRLLLIAELVLRTLGIARCVVLNGSRCARLVHFSDIL